MDAATRIENALLSAVALTDLPGCPPKLAAAMRYAVFPRGARVRPRLCLAVAGACGEGDPVAADRAAAAIELLHCASLVHDDLPCFDDATTRRGRASVHRAFGEQIALLAGDGLIVLAFQSLAMAPMPAGRLAGLLATIAGAVGAPNGIVAGQAWESEPAIDLAHYQRAKTGALFAAATVAGAIAAGHEADGWRQLGEALGEAYQVADDLLDAAGDESDCGKPIGRDAALGRPNAVARFGIPGAISRLEDIIERAAAAIPACAGAADLRAVVRLEAKRLVPKKLSRTAA